MKEFIDKTSEQSGTPINRANMMAVQGFDTKTIVINSNPIIETNEEGHTTTTTYGNGKITEVFRGNFVITKTITFPDDSTIKEEIS